MREHEVPTHVQAEDKVLLWFTFPQIVAVVAVCAVAYGAYRYFPFGPSEFRLGIAIILGIAGIALTVGKVGGRGLPLVAADLLKFNLGAGATPAPRYNWPAARPRLRRRPNPTRCGCWRKSGCRFRQGSQGGPQERASSFRPHSWFGKRRPKGSEHAKGGKPAKHDGQGQGKKPWSRFLPVAAGLLALALVALPSTALADDPDDEDPGWRLDEIYFQPPDPVPGRRIFIEGLSVTGDTARVSLRAAHDLDLKVRVFGGRTGRTLKMGANAIVHSGERKSYNLTLDGPKPSFTFSWTDSLGFSGAVSLKSDRIPYPLPRYDGGLCDLEVVSLEWTPGQIDGVIASECITETRQEVDLPVYGGHFSQSVPALLDASVARIEGRVNVAAGPHRTTANFVPGGQTNFRLAVANEKAVHDLEITAELTGTLNVPLPPMLQTTHHPARTDVYRRTVRPLLRGVLHVQDGHGFASITRSTCGPWRCSAHRSPAPGRSPCPGPGGGRGTGLAPGHGRRQPLPVPLRAPAHSPSALGGTDRGGRFLLVGLAVVGRWTSILLASGAALASVASVAPQAEREQMLDAMDAVLTGMAYAGVGLCLFAIVWAGFVLMAEGAEGFGRGKARNAVVMAIVGLVVVLLAKAIALLLTSRLVEILPGIIERGQRRNGSMKPTNTEHQEPASLRHEGWRRALGEQ